MSNEDQELLRSLVNAIKGDGFTGVGLIRQWQNLSDTLANYVEEQEKWRAEQQHVNQAHEERLRALEGQKPLSVTESSVYIAIAAIATLAWALSFGRGSMDGGLGWKCTHSCGRCHTIY